jgi:hypothetical protein
MGLLSVGSFQHFSLVWMSTLCYGTRDLLAMPDRLSQTIISRTLAEVLTD